MNQRILNELSTFNNNNSNPLLRRNKDVIETQSKPLTQIELPNQKGKKKTLEHFIGDGLQSSKEERKQKSSCDSSNLQSNTFIKNYGKLKETKENQLQSNSTRYNELFKVFLQKEQFELSLSSKFQGSIATTLDQKYYEKVTDCIHNENKNEEDLYQELLSLQNEIILEEQNGKSLFDNNNLNEKQIDTKKNTLSLSATNNEQIIPSQDVSVLNSSKRQSVYYQECSDLSSLGEIESKPSSSRIVLKGGVILKASRQSSGQKQLTQNIDQIDLKQNNKRSEIHCKDVISSTSVNETPNTSSFLRLNYSSEENSICNKENNEQTEKQDYLEDNRDCCQETRVKQLCEDSKEIILNENVPINKSLPTFQSFGAQFLKIPSEIEQEDIEQQQNDSQIQEQSEQAVAIEEKEILRTIEESNCSKTKNTNRHDSKRLSWNSLEISNTKNQQEQQSAVYYPSNCSQLKEQSNIKLDKVEQNQISLRFSNSYYESIKQKINAKIDIFEDKDNLKKLEAAMQESLGFIRQNQLRAATVVLQKCEATILELIPTGNSHKIYTYYLLVECLANQQRYTEMLAICSRFCRIHQSMKLKDAQSVRYCLKIFSQYARELKKYPSRLNDCAAVLISMLSVSSSWNERNPLLSQQEQLDAIIELASCQITLGRPSEALTTLGQIFSSFVSTFQKKFLQALLLKAKCLIQLKKLQEAKESLEYALSLSKTQQQDQDLNDQLFQIHEQLGQVNYQLQNYLKSISHYQDALRIIRNDDHLRKNEAIILGGQAKALVKLSEFESAIKNYRQAHYIICKVEGNDTSENACDCLFSISKIFSKQKNYDACIEILEEIQKTYASSYIPKNHIKNLNLYLLLLEKCLEGGNDQKYQLHENTLNTLLFTEKLSDSLILPTILNELGNILMKFSQFKSSTKYYSLALENLDTVLNKVQTAQIIEIRCNLANSLVGGQELLKGFESYKTALQESDSFHGVTSISSEQIRNKINQLCEFINKTKN